MATYELGKNAFFARRNPETGEYEKIESTNFLSPVNFEPKEGSEPIESINLSDAIGSITFTFEVPYTFFWHNTWQRGVTKPIRISLVPDGNPKDN